jgi:hypothetical protein
MWLRSRPFWSFRADRTRGNRCRTGIAEKAAQEGIALFSSEKSAYELVCILFENGVFAAQKAGMNLYVDLHIHSCLSPCADELMTPSNIAVWPT